MAWVRNVCLVGVTSVALMLGGICSQALCVPFPSWCGTISVVGATAIILGPLVWLPLFWSLLRSRRL